MPQSPTTGAEPTPVGAAPARAPEHRLAEHRLAEHRLAATNYEREEIRALVERVEDAADLVRRHGAGAFAELRRPGSRWREGEAYVFVLDADGVLVVHPDPSMEGRDQLELVDVDGKPIVRGLIAAASASADRPHGWLHYRWPTPGGLLPRWKSTYVKLVRAPSNAKYFVCSGVYDDEMERAFVEDLVDAAVLELERHGREALYGFRNPRGRFIAKDAYLFVFDLDGTHVFNAAFRNLEGRNLLDLTDTEGKPIARAMIALARSKGSGWIDYTWPKPGESVSTRKSAFIRRTKLGGRDVLVGCGVYLANAPRTARPVTRVDATQIVRLVHDAAALLAREGEGAFPELRRPGSRWLHDETYCFVWTMDGRRVLHPPMPESEGEDASGMQDILERPVGRMFLNIAASRAGEGWVHYMQPRPGELFPSWKSTFVTRVVFPSGKAHLVGCGIYDMPMDAAFIEDVVERAAELLASRGRGGFAELRDRRGPYVFMDTYVFVESLDGVELVNPAQPSLEGRNLLGLVDLRGRELVRDEIAEATKHGHAWLDVYWYKPGSNEPARKRTYVRLVRAESESFVVGSGIYLD
jgi:signal transduction histidine kinase